MTEHNGCEPHEKVPEYLREITRQVRRCATCGMPYPKTTERCPACGETKAREIRE